MRRNACRLTSPKWPSHNFTAGTNLANKSRLYTEHLRVWLSRTNCQVIFLWPATAGTPVRLLVYFEILVEKMLLPFVFIQSFPYYHFHRSLSWAGSIQSMRLLSILKVYFSIILPSTSGTFKWSPSFTSFYQKHVCTYHLSFSSACYKFHRS